MAGDWIKMRVSLSKDPAVIAMADYLAEQRPFMDWLTDPVRQSCSKSAYEHVTRNVTVAVTVNALLIFWGVANEVGKPDGDDLVMRHATLDGIDEACGVPCFGEAMQFVEWATQESTSGKSYVRLPKFLINNVPVGDRSRKGNAERQKRFREKHASLNNADSNVTGNVTVTPREEKRREDKEQKLCASANAEPHPAKSDPIPYQAIIDGYNRTMTRLPKVIKPNADRKAAIRKVWQSSSQWQSVSAFNALWEEYEDDSWCNGTGNYTNGHENWLPDFDYLIKLKTVTRVYERAMHRIERGGE